jgi:hypothetical protein
VRIYDRILSATEIKELCDVAEICDASAPPAAEMPTVTTFPEDDVTVSSFSAAGSVNPNGSATQAWFEWGEYADLRDATEVGRHSIGNGTTPMEIQEVIKGLESDTRYYYRIVAENAAGRVEGAVEEVRTASGLPLPDLVATDFYNRNYYVSGYDLNYSVEVTNTGGPMDAQVQFGVNVYFSTDATIDSSDTLIGTLDGGGRLGAGTGVTLTGSVNVPTSLSPGDYYIGVIVDPKGWVQESNETNNSQADRIVDLTSG